MPGPVFLDGEDVSLHTIEEEDAEFLQTLINDPEVRISGGSVDPKNRTQERSWIESFGETDDVNLLVCADGTPVGSIGLRQAKAPTWGVGDLGYQIAPDHWGNGYATEAVALVCQHAFEERRLHKVTAGVFEGNDASCRVLEKVGFEEEGRLREEAFVRGEHVDVRKFGLLAHEWNRARGETR